MEIKQHLIAHNIEQAKISNINNEKSLARIAYDITYLQMSARFPSIFTNKQLDRAVNDMKDMLIRPEHYIKQLSSNCSLVADIIAPRFANKLRNEWILLYHDCVLFTHAVSSNSITWSLANQIAKELNTARIKQLDSGAVVLCIDKFQIQIKAQLSAQERKALGNVLDGLPKGQCQDYIDKFIQDKHSLLTQKYLKN